MYVRGKNEDLIAFVAKLKGRKVLVRGNHDDVSDYRYQQLFAEICDYKEIYDSIGKEKYGLVLCHYPIFSWKKMGRGKILLYGHTHESEEDRFYQQCLDQMQESDCRHVYNHQLRAQGKPILIFLAGFFVLSVWEYFVGFLLEKLFKTKYWDYSNNKFNINGRVCLLNSIYWGFLSVFFIEIWNPLVETQLTKIPNDIILYIDIILVAYIVVDMILSSIKASNLSKRIKKLIQLGENLKEKLEELKKTSSEKLQIVVLNLVMNICRHLLYIYLVP